MQAFILYMGDNSPISQNQRTAVIDILRGWALFSVVIMNYSAIYNWNNHSSKIKPDNFTSYLETTCEVFLGSKGWTLLAILFGFGFSALLKNISQNGPPKYLFFIKRMLWLFVFAFINTLFFGGDILNDYAFMGLLLLLFYNLNTRSLFILGIAILVLTPLLQSYLGRLHVLFSPKDRDAFYELYYRNTFWDNIKANLFMRYKWMLRLSYSIILHLIQIGCFLIGAALHRSNFFSQLNSNIKTIKKVFWISLISSILLFFLQFLIEKNEWIFNKYYDLYYPQILCIMIFTTTGIIWLHISGKAKRLFSALQATGKMTLTNYMIQNIIAFILFISIRVNWALHWYLLAGLIIYSTQACFSKWWLRKYNYGLLEWLWRCLSYERMFQLKTK
jgi:uncharacterized protein